jgi:eukaryotic-like serine/threonine-protein kinase
VENHSSSAKAIFLSYASQDAAAAERICNALRQAGLEVWFDKGELRGGEAWDASIRKQVKGCQLFLPIISANTQAREEGYFRREWNLAVGRTLDMAHDKAFLLPVVVDATLESDARVPEKFREVQWTRLPSGDASATFVERVRGLMSSGPPASLAVPLPVSAMPITREDRPRKSADTKLPRNGTSKFIKLAVPALLLIGVGFFFILSWQKKEHARTELLPAIQEATSKMFRPNAQLFEMAMQAEKYLPNDPTLARLWPAIATTMSIDTEPAGAEVFWKDYDAPTEDWRLAGVTPFESVKVPRNYLYVEIRKKGYQTIEFAGPGLFSGKIVQHLRMDELGSLPENMVRVPTTTTGMNIVGLEKHGGKEVPEFLMDKFEVTNKEFKAFVDAGGYSNKAYWVFPILDGGKEIPLKGALATFTDQTGRQGPATWEAGSYPDGTENHPVTGVSWYEAAAYAAYAKKELPTVFHWAVVADTSRSEFILPRSNFSGKATAAVGSLRGFSTYGVYDLAGNAREWTFNQSEDPSQHFILGGGWTDASYAFNDSYTQQALDRSSSNGFRCIKELPGSPPATVLMQPISREFRDYTQEKPVDDNTYLSFARQFSYDKTALDAKVDKTIDTETWKAEVVSLSAGYNNERMQLYVYLPKAFTSPLQPVIFFPGSNGIHESHFDPAIINSRLVFLIKSGRALIFPIYKGTFERQDGLKSDLADETVFYKDHVIMWGKEFGRTIDYLETRKDIRADKIAYLGISWGGYMGGIIPAVEKRIKVVVLNVGGMAMGKSLPEVDQLNYLPRIVQPVLMLNGKYDMYFPVETSQKPMFKLLGTAKDDKKMIVYESGHVVPPIEFFKETLAWLDTYLGPVHQ